MTADRREFLRQASLAAAAFAAPGTAPVSHGTRGAPPEAASSQSSAAPPAPRPASQAAVRALDPVLLAALGEAVLPERLGADGRTAAVRAFSDWLARYTPVAEEMHGYGDAAITYTPSDPAPGWQAQLAGLDLLARRRHRRGFAALASPRRRAVVEAALARVGTRALPGNPLAAPHVAVALLAHWAASSAAVDLAYGARILRGECRTLADVTREPPALSPGEGR